MTAEFEILYLDDHLVVINKPAGICIHRGERSEDGEDFVLQLLHAQLNRYLYPVHRLDRGTSGVLAFALSRKAAAGLQASMQAEDSCKQYLTLVRGSTEASFCSRRPLTSEAGQKQPAISHFAKLAEFSRCSLLRARIETGRRHQIRRHLQHLAHQVIGDSTYGKGRINKWHREHFGLPRMFLHAEKLCVVHPISGEHCDWHAPLAKDLREYLLRMEDVDRGLVEML